MFVTLDGIFYQADVWLDGAYLGDPEGYFFPHRFDVTSLARLRHEHVLAVEVDVLAAARPRTPSATSPACFQHCESIDRHVEPGRPVATGAASTSPARCASTGAACCAATPTTPAPTFACTLASTATRRGRCASRTSSTASLLAQQRPSLARGINEVAWNLDIDNPQLWWPWSMGEQPLTDVRVEVAVDGELSDQHAVRTGLREVAVAGLGVLGERRAAVREGRQPRPRLRSTSATASADDVRRDIELAREAGLDLIRVQGHISAPELYDAADELGMLVWQDFPLHGGHARTVRRQAVDQARAAVDVLGPPPVDRRVVRARHTRRQRRVVGQQLPTWNRTILDRWVKRAFEKADETRPVIAHSGVMPHLPQLDGTDSHLHLGWDHGDERDLPGLAATIPRMVRFVSEFGAQSVPDGEPTSSTLERWPDLDWRAAGRAPRPRPRHRWSATCSPVKYTDASTSGATATQRYQATLLRHHIETLRRLKYRPAGGFCLSSLADPAPLISTSDPRPRAAAEARRSPTSPTRADR